MRKYVLAIVSLILLCLLAALGTASGAPGTFTVNTTGDTDDTTCDASHCSLREAIDAANSNPGSTIEFNIPATDTGYEVSGITGTWTISLNSLLPTLSGGGTIISGTTQAANQGDLNVDGPEIEITGAGVGSGNCLEVASACNVIHGLVINRCQYSGVALKGSGATTNIVSGNYIGTDATGTQDLGNLWHGVFVGNEAHSNFIGGDTSGERNIISGNNLQGVIISGGGVMTNTISGNYIGTDKTGMQDLPNSHCGVYIQAGAQFNLVGGDTPEERNVISGNYWDGVSIAGSGTISNTISGNYIGTDALGSSAVGNALNGIRIWAGAENVVGGDTEGERNIVSGNTQHGVRILGAMNNTISGNYIGTDASGSSELGNANDGVRIGAGAENNTVGGQTAGERNVISGNGRIGVSIYNSGTTSNTISGNFIGTDVTGTQKLGNGWDGVVIWDGAQYNLVGGDTPEERNVISGNDSDGVVIQGTGTMSNTVSGNFIGTVVTGTQKLGNYWDGVRIEDGAQNNTIGGTTSGERNVISGNKIGVTISGSGTMTNTVSGNYIGTDASGLSKLENAYYGVRISAGAENNTVGGQTAGERNVISGNDICGVLIYLGGTDGNTVCGNYIGTDATGTQELGNKYDGVLIQLGAQNNTVGGQTAVERNVISGNGWSGVYIKDEGTDGNTVSLNYIGTDETGTQDKGNGTDGVRIGAEAENNTIGPDNLISHNDLRGVFVTGSATTGNTITQNSIHSNHGLGIYLYDGGNGYIAAPTVVAADPSFVMGMAGAGDTVEIFTGPDEEGKIYLITTWADGNGIWTAVGPFTLDTYVTATATDASGNTSEFSTEVTPGAYYQSFLPLTMNKY